ncbi:DUF3084 domain-containing protein [Pelosinus sp. UFO1]|uniref:DUF3084 domain-containing protein n=1 Tax=Pelosinus sp. UFO1 TaxID=484770 RepID=UPI0004D14549|nr:DUF3084 domain-containing protein [Pelosinus sp. UFO1]AIF53750.1 Protein of unknown function DUF3084 [Pelosinus sp. UFO1]
MYGLTLIAILTITGGAIAYIGDKLGTKVGKKKLSIFGLRPKHTSIIVTIITGILITASTIGVLALVSQDVRTALFGMEALAKQLSTLNQEVTGKNAELATSRAALEAKNAEYTALTLKVKDTAERLSAITEELSAVMAQRDRTARELQQTQADYAVARGDLGKAQQAINTLQDTKNQLDKRVQSLNEAKVTLQEDVDRLNQLTTRLGQGIQVVREGSIIYRAGEVLSTVILPGGESKSDTERALAEAIYDTNQHVIDRLGIEDRSLNVLWIAQADFDKVATTLAKIPQDAIVRITANGNTVYGEPVIGQINLFPNNRIYAKGETVQMAVIDLGSKTEQPEEAVMSFLRKVNVTAVNKGILPDPIQGTVGAMNGAEFYDTVNKVKRYNKGKVMITATAKEDTYAVGPLKIEMHIQGGAE